MSLGVSQTPEDSGARFGHGTSARMLGLVREHFQRIVRFWYAAKPIDRKGEEIPWTLYDFLFARRGVYDGLATVILVQGCSRINPSPEHNLDPIPRFIMKPHHPWSASGHGEAA